jgi:hypothetical protein
MAFFEGFELGLAGPFELPQAFCHSALQVLQLPLDFSPGLGYGLFSALSLLPQSPLVLILLGLGLSNRLLQLLGQLAVCLFEILFALCEVVLHPPNDSLHFALAVGECVLVVLDSLSQPPPLLFQIVHGLF